MGHAEIRNAWAASGATPQQMREALRVAMGECPACNPNDADSVRDSDLVKWLISHDAMPSPSTDQTAGTTSNLSGRSEMDSTDIMNESWKFGQSLARKIFAAECERTGRDCIVMGGITEQSLGAWFQGAYIKGYCEARDHSKAGPK